MLSAPKDVDNDSSSRVGLLSVNTARCTKGR